MTLIPLILAAVLSQPSSAAAPVLVPRRPPTCDELKALLKDYASMEVLKQLRLKTAWHDAKCGPFTEPKSYSAMTCAELAKAEPQAASPVHVPWEAMLRTRKCDTTALDALRCKGIDQTLANPKTKALDRMYAQEKRKDYKCPGQPPLLK